MGDMSLTIFEERVQRFPTIFEGLKRAESIFDSIKDWKDIKRLLLVRDFFRLYTHRNSSYPRCNSFVCLPITRFHPETTA